MQEILSVFSGIALVITIFGGGLSSIVFGYAGIQWMIAAGDPQKQAQARSALFGAFVGLIIVGVAFLIPGIISQLIIEPAGGAPIVTRASSGCDQHLQRQLVVTPTATNASRMQALVRRIQSQREACGRDVWDPLVHPAVISSSDRPYKICFTGSVYDENATISNSAAPGIPADLIRLSAPVGRSTYGADGNILIYFGPDPFPASADVPNLPSSGSTCWLYQRDLDRWDAGSPPN